MRYEGDRAGRDTANHRDSDGQDEQLRGTRRSIQPGRAVPPTVLVVNMGDGSLVLQTWRDGPSVYLSPADAVPLRRDLAAAFTSAALAPLAEQDEAR